MTYKHLPLWAATCAAFLAASLPRLLTEGMFMDGLLYGVISRNLAEGVGTLWKPVLTPTMTPDLFCDHPPLVFGIQSLFFRVLGDYILVEKAYSFFTAIVSGGLIVALWRRFTKPSHELMNLAWLPVLFWTMIPLVTWSYSHNMLENTLSIFTLVTALVLLRGLMAKKNLYLHVFVAAVLICGGLLSKGVVALFPLSTIGFFWLFNGGIRFRTAAILTTLLISLVVAMMVALLQIDAINYNLSKYMEVQFLPAIQGRRGALPTRFGVFTKLFSELAPLVGVCAVVLVLNRFKRYEDVFGSATHRFSAMCIAIGVSGSVPLVLSPRQSGFYLVPSFAFFALGFALLVAPVISNWAERIDIRSSGFKVFAVLAAVLLISVIGISAAQLGTANRDVTLIRDVKLIRTVVPADSRVTICNSMWQQWHMHGYFARYARISLDRNEPNHRYAVKRDEDCTPDELARFQRVNLDTRYVHLYRRK